MKRIAVYIMIVLLLFLCKNPVYAKDVAKNRDFVVSQSDVNRIGAQSAGKKLSKPMIGSVTATSKATIKFIWSPVENAQKYEIYRASTKKGSYKKIATTKKLHIQIKLENN